MSSDITGIGGSDYLSSVGSTLSAGNPTGATSTPNVASTDDDAVTVDLSSSRSELPPELSAAIATASGAYDRLAASGKHVHFSSDPQTGELSSELQSADGSTQPLSAADVLNLASGDGSA